MSNSPERSDAKSVLSRVLGPSAPELSCEECFAELDRYAELALAGGDADEQVPGMRTHLEGCPACAEDLRSLMAMLAEREPPA
jgi:hypothetical protein